jgi:hypothetical protein
MRKSLVLMPVVTLSLSVGCHRHRDAETAGYQPAQTAAPPVQSVAPPAPTAPPPAAVPGPIPPATPSTDPALAAAVQPMLTKLASTQTVAGSKPQGTVIVGNLVQGQTLELQTSLQPNKCYSVVAVGLPPIAELNVQLIAETIIPGMAPVLAQDEDVGPTAVLGRKPNCFKWALPLPVPVRVSVQAVSGQGVVAMQVFEK